MKHGSRRKCTLIFLLVVFSNLAGDAAEFQLKPEFVCRRPLVKVGDIVEFRNLRRDEAEEIAEIELFAAPPNRESRNLKVSELRELLTLHGVDLAAIQFRGADQIQIRRAENRDETRDPSQNQAKAKMAFHARRAIARGDVIRATDIEPRPLTLSTKVEYATRAEDVIGHAAIRGIEPGQPLPMNALQRPIVVSKNETISLVARSAGVQVRTSVKALDDGALGELITIETLDKKNKNKLAARVVGPKTVEIYAGVPVVSSNK